MNKKLIISIVLIYLLFLSPLNNNQIVGTLSRSIVGTFIGWDLGSYITFCRSNYIDESDPEGKYVYNFVGIQDGIVECSIYKDDQGNRLYRSPVDPFMLHYNPNPDTGSILPVETEKELKSRKYYNNL